MCKKLVSGRVIGLGVWSASFGDPASVSDDHTASPALQGDVKQFGGLNSATTFARQDVSRQILVH